MNKFPGGIFLTKDEQMELLARSRRTETMLYRLMEYEGIAPRLSEGHKEEVVEVIKKE